MLRNPNYRRGSSCTFALPRLDCPYYDIDSHGCAICLPTTSLCSSQIVAWVIRSPLIVVRKSLLSHATTAQYHFPEIQASHSGATIPRMGEKKQPPSDWTIEIGKARFNELKSQERFWQLVALSRAVNALRFVQMPLRSHEAESDSLHATRTRFNSFFFTCSLLYEALKLAGRMRKHFHQTPEFDQLHRILKDPAATKFKESNLNRIRNQLTFHFFEREVGAQLVKSDFNPRFVIGQGDTNADVYYELADACALGAFSGFQLSQPGAVEQFATQAQIATDLAVRFVDAAENFLNATLKADGWKLVEKTHQS